MIIFIDKFMLKTLEDYKPLDLTCEKFKCNYFIVKVFIIFLTIYSAMTILPLFSNFPLISSHLLQVGHLLKNTA